MFVTITTDYRLCRCANSGNHLYDETLDNIQINENQNIKTVDEILLVYLH